MNRKIYFVVSEIPEILQPYLDNQANPFRENLSFLQHSHWWGSQEWVWIVQTFFYVREAGLDVELVDQPVPNEICVTHFVTTKNKVWGPDSFIIGIRSDTSPMRMREVEIVQSPKLLKSQNSFFICLWPQAQLTPRAATRGNRIEKMSYFGGPGGLSPKFYESSFRNALKEMGIELDLCFNTALWSNYHNTDLVIAIRNHHHSLLVNTKPASKLINAWQAGCVAILGKEPAYQAIGQSGNDYFEVNSPKDVLDVVYQLKENPQMYQSVRQAGMARYTEYSFEAIKQQWTDILTGPISESFATWKTIKDQDSSKYYQHRQWQSIRQWIDHKAFYFPVRAKEWLNKFNAKTYPQKNVNY